MSYDSGVEPGDVRTELGTLDTPVLGDGVIQQQISHAETHVAAVAGASATDEQREWAVIAVAARRTLENHHGTFAKRIEELDTVTQYDVGALMDATSQRAASALGIVTRDSSRYVDTTGKSGTVEGAERPR